MNDPLLPLEEEGSKRRDSFMADRFARLDAPKSNAQKTADDFMAERLNKYDTAVRVTTRAAVEQNPEQVGATRRAAQTLEVPPGATAIDPELAKIQARAAQVEQALGMAPAKVATAFRHVADVGHDEAEKLALMGSMVAADGKVKEIITGEEYSRRVREVKQKNPTLDWDTAREIAAQNVHIDNTRTGLVPPKPTLENLAKGVSTTLFEAQGVQMWQGLRRIFGDYTTDSRLASNAALERQKSMRIQQLETPKVEGYVPGAMYSGVHSTLASLPSYAAGLVGGMPLAAASMFLQQFIPEYNKFRDRGASISEATVGATGSGVAEAAFERLGMKYMLDTFGKVGFGAFLKGWLFNQGKEVRNEGLTTITQTAIDTAIANPNKSWGQWAKELPGALGETVISTLTQGAIMGGASKAVNMAAGPVLRAQWAAQQAELRAQYLDSLNQAVGATKVLQRDARSLQAFLQEAAADGPVENLYIPANVFAQAAGENLELIKQQVPAIAEQIDEALARGGDLVLPVGEIVALQGTGMEQVLIDNARTTDDPSDMSRAEAKVFLQQEAQRFEAAAAKMVAEVSDNAARATSRTAVENALLADMESAGTFTKDVNAFNAKMAATMFDAMGRRLGQTAEQVFQTFALRVTDKPPGGSQSNMLTQPTPTLEERAPEGTEILYRLGWANEVDKDNAGAWVGDADRVARHLNDADENDKEAGDTFYAYAVPAGAFTPDEGTTANQMFRSGKLPPGAKLIATRGVQDRTGPARSTIWGHAPLGMFDVKGADIKSWLEGAPSGRSFDQSTALRAGKESLRKYGILPGKKYTTRQIARAFELRQAAKYGRIDVKDYSYETAKKIGRWMADEVMFEMQHPEDSAVGWYSVKNQQAIDKAGELYPELKTDQAARDVFTLMLAVTSDGIEANQNFKMALGVYNEYREGRPLRLLMAADKNPNIVGHIAKLSEYLKNHDAKDLRALLLKETTVAEMNKALREAGETPTSDYLAATKLPLSAVVLGPKIGAFAANLLGSEGYLTMDRWWTRTFNRYRGQLTFGLEAASEKHLALVREAMGSENASEEEVLAFVKPIVAALVDRRFKDPTALENAANRVWATVTKTRDVPANGRERAFMISSAVEAQNSLKRRGVEMSIADIQAVLWYYEKRLYPSFGARPSPVGSYLDAARTLIPALLEERRTNPGVPGGRLNGLGARARQSDAIAEDGDGGPPWYEPNARGILGPDLAAEVDRALAMQEPEAEAPGPSPEDRARAEKALMPLQDRAQELKPSFDAALTKIADALDGHVKLPGVKGLKRAAEKLLSDYQAPDGTLNVGAMQDMLRATIVVRSPADLQAALDGLGQAFEFTRIKNRTSFPLEGPRIQNMGAGVSGYFDILTNVKVGDVVAEVQIHVPELFAMKNAFGHDLYNIERRLDDGPYKDSLLDLQRRVYGAALTQMSERLSSTSLAKASVESATPSTAALPTDPNGLASGPNATADLRSGESATAAFSTSSNVQPDAASSFQSIGTSNPIVPQKRQFGQTPVAPALREAANPIAPAGPEVFTAAGIASLLRRSDWAIFTAENPNGQQLPAEQNAERMVALREQLTQMGVQFVDVVGKYGNLESSVAITGITEDQAVALAQQWGQESVLTRKGLVYRDGSIKPSRGLTVHKTAPDDYFTALPDGTTFTVDIDFENTFPAQTRRVGEVSVAAVHFSKEARTLLDPSKYGTGMKGAETPAAEVRNRTHWYVSTGQGVFPESDVGPFAHVAKLDNLYDASADPLGIWKAGGEVAVRDAGFDGYVSRTFGNQAAAVLFDNGPVPVSYVGGAAQANQTVANTSLPPPQLNAQRKLMAEIMADTRLPMGQIERSRWKAIMQAVDPSYVERLPARAFEGDERVYRDELLRVAFDQRDDVQDRTLAKYQRLVGVFQDLKLRRSRESLQSRADSAFEKNRLAPGVYELRFSDVALQGEPTISTSPKELARIAELTEAIRKSGVIEPLQVGMHTDGAMYVMEGQHRARALKALGYESFPAQVAMDTTPGGTEKRLYGGEWPAVTPEPFEQKPEDLPPNARIHFNDFGDITASPSIIEYLKTANLSSFHHELGHFYLEMLYHVATQPGAPASVVDDMNRILEWFGVKDIATWTSMDIEQRRPFHEQFARGYEAYLFEGKAPATELKSVMQRVREWMIAVYQDIRKLGVELTPEIKGVYDRMLASDEQIKAMEDERNMMPLFKSAEEMGATPEEWLEYQRLAADATQDAVETLQARSLREMQWLTNARGRMLRKMQRDVSEKRGLVEAEVLAEVEQQPVYAARKWLAYGILPTGEQTVGAKLDLDALREMYGDSPAAIWRYLPTGEKGLAGKEGMHPDQVAEMFGFSSGDALVRALVGAEKQDSVVEGMTDQRMLERYGDLQSPAGIERAVNEALHNEARGRMIAAELAALQKAMSPTEDTGRKVTDSKGRTRRITTSILPRAARSFAETLLARTKIGEIRPSRYVAAEVRAAKAAERASKLEEKIVEKRNQLVNHYAAKLGAEALDEIERSIAYLRKFENEGTRENLADDYLDQIDQILEGVELKRISEREQRRRTSLRDWVDEQEEMGLSPVIDPALLDAAGRVNYRTMTLEEFRGMVDSVKSIEHLGRLKQKLLTAKDKREFQAVVDEMYASAKDNANRDAKVRIEQGRGLDRVGKMFRQALAMHRKFASIIREIDGGKDGGVWWERLVRTMNEAGDNQVTMRTETALKLHALVKQYLGDSKLNRKQEVLPGISLTREAMIVMALNWGNEGNRQRLLDGGFVGTPITLAQAEAVIFKLTDAEWSFVEGVWALFESFRPQIAEQEKRLSGVEPKWIDASPFTLPSGRAISGGYFPAKYDTDLSTRAGQLEELTALRLQTKGAMGRASTRADHVQRRAAEVKGRALRKDFGVIVQRLNEVTHRLAWQDWLVDAGRILGSRQIDSVVREHYGPEILAELRAQLSAIATGDSKTLNAVERILAHIRQGVSIAGMGWNVMTSLIQPAGYTQSAVRIGTQWAAVGLGKFAANPLAAAAEAREKSKFMANRALTINREISEIVERIDSKEMSTLKATYFWLIQKVQSGVDIPTWHGAYERAIAEGNDEKRAIAMADQAVIDSQGNGHIKDLAEIQRGSEAAKLFTSFYNFFNTTHNMTAERTRTAGVRHERAKLISDYLLLLVVPAMMNVLLRSLLKGEDDDPEKLLKKYVGEQISYLLGTNLFTREIGGAIAGAIQGFPYSGPASMRIFTETGKLIVQAGQGEVDKAALKAANNVAGILLHYPAGQVQRTVEGIYEMNQGNQPITAPVFGPVRE